ncbi:MAG: T9SS type A sorting domain-containing protein [Weeksellaceae bacterium]|nr:T9SS type A sorting domain-containing protein [Weeksellaceae bacterium]
MKTDMKKLFLILIVLLITISLKSQNSYQTVYSNRTAYFRGEYNLVETIKIDSCKFNNDSILFPSRTLQLIGDECYDPFGGSWAGKKIIIHNHWNYFFNDDHDTIRIKTNAALNENWNLFQKPDITIIATVTSWDTLTVLGVLDSVKIITLHVYDHTMKPQPHELEGTTIAISKHFGLTKTLNFTHFPTVKFRPAYYITKNLDLIGITNPELGQQHIKWFDVFDFQEGDEFHYVNSSNSLMFGGSAHEKIYIIRIIKRENFADSIRYTEQIETLLKYRQNTSSDYITTYDNQQVTNVVYKNAEFDHEPGVPVFRNDSSMLVVYPSFSVNSSPEIYFKKNDCWHKSHVLDDACNYTSYEKGRGLIASSSGCWEWQSYNNTQQVYYKKNSSTWGTPLLLTNINELLELPEIKVYPNPTADRIYVYMNDFSRSYSFELLDAKGETIKKTELKTKSNIISLEELNSGLYFYRLTKDNKQIKSGKIIKI